MPGPTVDIEQEPTPSEEQNSVSQTVGSVFMSMLFWSVMLVAGSCYAVVALTPKLADWMQVRQTYLENADRLRQLESEVDYLERVAEALKADPEFAHRLAGVISGESVRWPNGASEEFIPVSEELMFGGVPAPQSQPTETSPTPLRKLIGIVASNTQYRRWLLTFAAILTVTAFTLLNDTGIVYVRGILSMTAAGISMLISRYRRPRHSDETGDTADAEITAS